MDLVRKSEVPRQDDSIDVGVSIPIFISNHVCDSILVQEHRKTPAVFLLMPFAEKGTDVIGIKRI